MADKESMPSAPASLHYQMSDGIRHKVEIPVWLGNNKDDPALQASMPQVWFSYNFKLNLAIRIFYLAWKIIYLVTFEGFTLVGMMSHLRPKNEAK